MAQNNGGERMYERRNTDNERQRRIYEKKLTVEVDIEREDRVTMMELLRQVKEECGAVIGCRYKTPRKYELTMHDVNGKDKLMDGIKINNNRIMARELNNDELVVSFLALPTYIEDEEILQKLREWGVNAVSSIKRRVWPGTDIVDGTRFVKVKFTDTVKSLPYSTRLQTLQGIEHFRVIHDRQVKVCRLCIQPGHILRDCPEFTCYKCGKQGHYARECAGEEKCPVCRNIKELCMCGESAAFREDGSRQEEETSAAGGEKEETQEPEGEEEKNGSQNTAVTPQEPSEVTDLGSSMDGVAEEQGLSEEGKIGRGVDAGPHEGPGSQTAHVSTSKDSPPRSGIPLASRGRGRAARAAGGGSSGSSTAGGAKEKPSGKGASVVPESIPASGKAGTGGKKEETGRDPGQRKDWKDIIEHISEEEMEVAAEEVRVLKRKKEELEKKKKHVKK